jgi:DNA-binding transcriptional MerR regulator
MRIGELARRAGVSPRSVRYYERQGLLSASRDPNGYRRYDEDDLVVVREIRARIAAGFTLAEARPFVECLRAGNPSGDVCPAPREMYRRKLAELDACISRMSALRDQVAAQLAAADAAGLLQITNRPASEEP